MAKYPYGIAPPRADNRILPSSYGWFEKRHWWCQTKMNGEYLIVTRTATDTLSAINRHGEAPAWQWTKETRELWLLMPPGTYCAELLHNKVKGIRNTFYLHDILGFMGGPLLGKSYEDRYALLRTAVATIKEETPHYYIVRPNFWLARNIHSNFRQFFESLTSPEHEGIVLKNPKAVLSYRNDPGWSVKTRKAGGNYSH